jgi:hypothetical protein
LKLTCAIGERADLQCKVIENGEQCNHGVRNVKRMLCVKHYARWQRNGHVDVILPNGGSQPKNRREVAAVRRQNTLATKGLSTICLCTHRFLEHYVHAKCRVKGCECRRFESTSEAALLLATFKMNSIGFFEQLNDNARCRYCRETVRVGYWYDQYAINRMREHIRLYHLKIVNSRVS